MVGVDFSTDGTPHPNPPPQGGRGRERLQNFRTAISLVRGNAYFHFLVKGFGRSNECFVTGHGGGSGQRPAAFSAPFSAKRLGAAKKYTVRD
jgi:hypothetical protein